MTYDGFISISGWVIGVVGLVLGIYSVLPIYSLRDRGKGPRWQIARGLLEASLYPELAPEDAYRFVRPILARCSGLPRVLNNRRLLVRAARLYVERRHLLKYRHNERPAPAREGADAPPQALRVPRPPPNPLLRFLNVWYDDSAVHLLSAADWGGIDSDLDQKQPASFDLPTSFALNDLEDMEPEPRCYFEALSVAHGCCSDFITADDIGPRDQFLSPVRIENGFAAPLLLIAGLERRFENSWPQLLARYDEDSELRHGDARAAFLTPFEHKLQTFTFYCWLLWGPSIPLCTCKRWDVGYVAIGQYGFGDEDNSFPLFIEAKPAELHAEPILAPIGGAPANDGAKSGPLAVQTRLTAELYWGPAHAQFREIADKHASSVYVQNGNPRFEGLVLRALPDDKHGVDAQPLPYYSAYLWAIIELRDPSGGPLPSNDGRWRNLLPVFEHANLADGETLLDAKRRLAGKVLDTLTAMSARPAEIHPPPPARAAFRYVCAVDDPGPGHAPAVASASASDQGIRAILQRAYEARRDSTTGASVPLEFPPADEQQDCSACDLPDVIDAFIAAHTARAMHAT